MGLLQIPTRTDVNNYEEQVTLEEATYTFKFIWNYRGEFWSMSILDANDVEIVSGIAVRVDIDLLKYVGSSRKPPGSLVAYDTSGANEDPGLEDLGGRVILLYQEST